MRRYFEFVLSHRLLVCLVLVLISALATASLSRAVLGSTLQRLFFGDSPEYQHYLEKAQQFGNDEIFFVGIEDSDPLRSESLDTLDRAIERMEADVDIARVSSVLGAQRIGDVDGFIEVQSYGQAARDRPDSRLELMAELREDPLVGGLLVSEDGQSHVLIVELSVNPERNPEQRPYLVQEMLDILEEEGVERGSMHTVGLPPLLQEMLQQSYSNLLVSFPITVGVMVGLVLLIFRRLAPAVVATGVSILAVLWTMGFATELDRHHSIMSTIIPAVVLVVAVSDVIHLWSAYLEELRSGRSKHEAILESATDVGRACLWTSITTFVGFVCLSMVPTPVFRLMGIVLGLGVAIALILAMTLVPMVLSWMAEPTIREESERHASDRFLRWTIDGCVRVTTRYPWRVLMAFGLLLVWVGLGLSQFSIETRFSERISEDTSYRQDVAWFDANFHGTQTVDIFIESPEPEGLLEADSVQRIAAMERRVRQLPEVDGVFSYTAMLEQLMVLWGQEAPLPETDAQVAQLFLSLEQGGEESLKPMINFERDSMRASVRLNVEGIREIWRLSETIEDIGEEELGGLQVEVTGIISLFGWWVDAILEGQKNGLMMSIFLIALMMMCSLRSVRAGLISMIPNVLPLLTVAAFMGWWTDAVDSDTLVIGMMAIGIGVDDTIHFLVRYRIEAERCASRELALRRTFGFAGRAIFITTVILSFGFLPLAMSDYLPLWFFGVLLPLALVVALVADLLLVPALAQLGIFRFHQSSPVDTTCDLSSSSS